MLEWNVLKSEKCVPSCVLGKQVYQCNLGCKPSTHYHCFKCGVTVNQKTGFILHIKRCTKTGPTAPSPTPLPGPPAPSPAAAPPAPSPAAPPPAVAPPAAPPPAVEPPAAPPSAAPPAVYQYISVFSHV